LAGCATNAKASNNLGEEEVVLLVAVYSKADRSNMSPSEIGQAV
jgi:helix-turn-helix protein